MMHWTATKAVSTEPVAAPGTIEPSAEDVETATVPADGVDEDAVAELATAMGTVAERRVAAPIVDERMAAELVVAELAIAMGTLAEFPDAELPGAEPPLAELAAEEPAVAEPAFDEPAECESVVAEPAFDEPSEREPANAEPAFDEPAERRPAVAEPALDELADGAPAVAIGLDQAVVAVIGLRSVGLPAAIALGSADARVIGIERSASRLEEIRSGRAELLGSQRAQLRGHLRDARLALTDDIESLAAAEFVLICVPTLLDRERRPNLDALADACGAAVAHARPGQTFVLASTTGVGSTRELLVEPLEERGLQVGEDVFVAFSPERIGPGVPAHEQPRTPRVLGAVTERCFENASKLLRPICDGLHRVSSPEAAEMVKLYESTFRAVNIALACEMADACKAHDLDTIEVIDAAATKAFGFMAHYPSAGVGGSSIAVDPHHLTQPLRDGGRPATVTEEALRKVIARPRHVVWRAQELLVRSGSQLSDARVLVVGASYKPGIADSCHAPAVEIISMLQAEGVEVEYHDPLLRELRVDGEVMSSVDPDPRRDASGFGPEDYALAIVVTVHPGHDYGWLRRVPEVLDCTYRTQAGRRRFVP